MTIAESPDGRRMDVDARNLFLQAVVGLMSWQRRLAPLRRAATEPCAHARAEGDELLTLAIVGALHLDDKITAATARARESAKRHGQTTAPALSTNELTLRALLR